MRLRIQGRGRVLDEDLVEGPLIGIARRRFDADIGRNASENNRPNAPPAQMQIEIRAVEGAVAFLDYDVIACSLLQLWQDLGSFGPGDRDGDTTTPHVEKRVAEIWPDVDEQ